MAESDSPHYNVPRFNSKSGGDLKLNLMKLICVENFSGKNRGSSKIATETSNVFAMQHAAGICPDRMSSILCAPNAKSRIDHTPRATARVLASIFSCPPGIIDIALLFLLFVSRRLTNI